MLWLWHYVIIIQYKHVIIVIKLCYCSGQVFSLYIPSEYFPTVTISHLACDKYSCNEYIAAEIHNIASPEE